MIIIKKKNIFILFLLFILLFLFFYNKKIVPTSSIPVSNHVIILDAGHGYPDGGATGKNNTIESDLNLEVVLKLQKYLEASGTTVLLTRSDENGIYDTDSKTIRNQKISDMKNRVKIANNSDAEIFVSVHMNKIPEEKYSGWQTFYKNNDEKSKQIANQIQISLDSYMNENENENKNNSTRKIKSISGIYLTQNVEIPLVLIECGFLSNENESILLKSEAYQEKLAWSIYTGLIDFWGT